MLKNWLKETFIRRIAVQMLAVLAPPSLFTKAAMQDESSSIEIKLCAFIAEHSLAISLSDNLVELLWSLSPLNPTLKNVTLGKQKATNIIRQVIGFDYLQEAVSVLCEWKFSVVIDETTDVSTLKQLAILVTYFEMELFAGHGRSCGWDC